MRYAVPVAFAAGLLSGCSSDRVVDMDLLAGHRYQLADGAEMDWRSISGGRGTVLITLDPECPFCQGYAPVIDSLAERCTSSDVRFIGIYCSPFIPADSASHFATTVGFDFPQVMDPDCRIARAVHARVTPECFLLDPTGRLLYHGAIDDWAVRAGKHRATATEHFLATAIEALVAQRSPEVAMVIAKGCIVECAETDVYE